MAWYNPLTWRAKTVDNFLDKDDGLLAKFGGWVGNQQFTDQEQANYRREIADKAAEFVGKTLSENTVRSKTRRRIADSWILTQLFLVFMTAIFIPFDRQIAGDYFNLATSDIMLWGTGSIIVFFFGGYVWGTHIKGSVKKQKE